MTSFRLKQIGLTLCVMTALIVGSASACTCSHHEAEVKPVVLSCHHHSEMADGSGPQIENNGDRVATDDDCICAENAQKIVAKSESIKLKKHGALTSVELPSSVAVVETLQALTLGFVKPTYLTDSFYNLSLSRGPPARL